MTREEFENWIGNPFMLCKRDHPSMWGGSLAEIQRWEENPYSHPYTMGAYAMLRKLS